MDDFGPDTWVAKHDLVDSPPGTQYIASYHWALQTITTVGFGDLAPTTPIERILAILWMIVGVGVYSFTIGNLSSILANMDRRSTILKKKISTFNNFSSKVKLPDFLRQKVQRFFELNHKENVYYWIDPSDMLKHLPENLKSTVLLYSYHKMIKDIEILELNANFTAALLLHLKLLKLDKREILYREGDPTQEIYFISKGSIKMVNEHGQGIFSLVQGTYFGELEILENSKRLCFAQACEASIVIVCDKTIFLETLKEFPDVEAKIKKVAGYRRDKLNARVVQLDEEAMNSSETLAKGNKKPLFKSTDYFYNVLLNNGPKIKKGRGGFLEPRNTSNSKKSLNSLQNIHPDPLDTFKKLQDYTGAIDSNRRGSKKFSLLNTKVQSPTEQQQKNGNLLSESPVKIVLQENSPKNAIQDPPRRESLTVPSIHGKNFDKMSRSPKMGEDNKNKGSGVISGSKDMSQQSLTPIAKDQGARFMGSRPTTKTTTFLDLSNIDVDKLDNPAGFSLNLADKEEKKSGQEEDKSKESNTKAEEEEGDFAKHMRQLEEQNNPRIALQSVTLSNNKTMYMNLVKKGFVEVKKLKESVETTYSDLENKKRSIVETFGSIADRQQDMNANVEKLFNMAK